MYVVEKPYKVFFIIHVPDHPFNGGMPFFQFFFVISWIQKQPFHVFFGPFCLQKTAVNFEDR